MAVLFRLPFDPFFLTGELLAGGSVTFCQPGTLTLATVYTGDDLGTPAQNPATLDSVGQIEQGAIYLGDQDYRVIVKNSAGTVIPNGDIDPVHGAVISGDTRLIGKLGIGMSPVNVLDITQTQDASSRAWLKNASTGTAAAAQFVAQNSVNFIVMTMTGTGFTPGGMTRADGGQIGCSGAGGLSVFTSANQPIYLGVNGTEVARLTPGRLAINNTLTASALSVQGTGTDNVFTGYNVGGNYMFAVGSASLGVATGESAVNSMALVRKDSTSNRSINAAGTINASGADYAEYEKKAAGCGTVSPGQIVGFDSAGRITDKWADVASRFGVKSTEPSYVGGDSWGSEEEVGIARDDLEFAAALEAIRVTMDRIAYAGKCPCNVTGASVGDYIIPEQDGAAIKGTPIASPTFDQYRAAVGRVIAILPDTRCTIALMVH